VVLELKIAGKKKTMARALAEGAAQIEESGYRAELVASGVSPLHALVVGFDGKKVAVRSAGEAARGQKTAKRRKKAPAKKAVPRRR
jgi:hypothetical protein